VHRHRNGASADRRKLFSYPDGGALPRRCYTHAAEGDNTQLLHPRRQIADDEAASGAPKHSLSADANIRRHLAMTPQAVGEIFMPIPACEFSRGRQMIHPLDGATACKINSRIGFPIRLCAVNMPYG